MTKKKRFVCSLCGKPLERWSPDNDGIYFWRHLNHLDVNDCANAWEAAHPKQSHNSYYGKYYGIEVVEKLRQVVIHRGDGT